MRLYRVHVPPCSQIPKHSIQHHTNPTMERLSTGQKRRQPTDRKDSIFTRFNYGQLVSKSFSFNEFSNRHNASSQSP